MFRFCSTLVDSVVASTCCDTPGRTNAKSQVAPNRMASALTTTWKGTGKVYIKSHPKIPRIEVSVVRPQIVRKRKRSGHVWTISASIACECIPRRPMSMNWSGSQLLSQKSSATCSIDNDVGPSWMLDRQYILQRLTMELPIKSSCNTILIAMNQNYHLIPICNHYRSLRLSARRQSLSQSVSYLP